MTIQAFRTTNKDKFPRRQLESYAQEVINSLTEGVVVLDGQGIVICVNNAWSCFGNENGAGILVNNFIGVNYLVLCDQVVGLDAEYANAMADGIRSVMRSEKLEFFEFPVLG